MKQLDAHLVRIVEAEKRDHRRLGRTLFASLERFTGILIEQSQGEALRFLEPAVFATRS